MEEMMQRAAQMGANAVVGIDIDYEMLGSDNGMMMVTVSGTAVLVDLLTQMSRREKLKDSKI